MIALVQAALAAYYLYYLALALLNAPEHLGALRSALRLLIGRTDPYSYAQSPREDIVVDRFFLGVMALLLISFGARTAWVLWRLEKWARHTVAAEYGMQLAFWARGFLAFGIGGGFSHVGNDTLQPIYMVMTVEAILCLTLWFHGGVAEAFGEEE